MNKLNLRKFKGRLCKRIDDRLNAEQSDAGVGLIEMIVALAILAIGLVGFIGVYVAVGKATKMAADRQAAINIAAQQLSVIEGFESINWQYYSSSGGGIPSSVLSYSGNVGSTKFTAATTVTNCTGYASAAELQATVDVSWNYGSSTYHYSESVQLTPSAYSVGVPLNCPFP